MTEEYSRGKGKKRQARSRTSSGLPPRPPPPQLPHSPPPKLALFRSRLLFFRAEVSISLPSSSSLLESTSPALDLRARSFSTSPLRAHASSVLPPPFRPSTDSFSLRSEAPWPIGTTSKSYVGKFFLLLFFPFDGFPVLRRARKGRTRRRRCSQTERASSPLFLSLPLPPRLPFPPSDSDL